MLNWEAVGAIAEGLGAIAVIMSVLYLAVQIRSQTREARLTATRELASEYLDRTEYIIRDKALTELHRVGVHDYMALPEDDRMRVSLMWLNLLRVMEQQYLHNHHASIDNRYSSSILRGQSELMAFPGIQTWWEFSRDGFDDEFRLHIDMLIKQAQATTYKSSFKPAARQAAEPAE